MADGHTRRRRTLGAAFGLSLLLVGGTVTDVGAVRTDPTTVTDEGMVLIPRSVAVQTRSVTTASAARASSPARRQRLAAVVSQAIADRWAGVPVPEDAAAALALRARVLFDRHDAGDPEALAHYRRLRRQLAAEIAGRLALPVAELRAAWRSAPLGHQRALMAALSQIGVPYRSMASREWQGFDCSGLTSFAWAQAGVAIPRSSGDQIATAARRSLDTAQAGDLVQYPGHVSMYLGVADAIVHSPYSGRDVEVDRLTRSSVRFGDPTA